MRRWLAGLGEDRALRLARLGDNDVEDAVLAIECKEAIWAAITN
jgi:hypothetical protein